VRFLNFLPLLSKNDAISENETLLFISTSMSGSKPSKYFGTCPEKQFYAHRARGITDWR
jgi:type IV secretory pathway protease TraF